MPILYRRKLKIDNADNIRSITEIVFDAIERGGWRSPNTHTIHASYAFDDFRHRCCIDNFGRHFHSIGTKWMKDTLRTHALTRLTISQMAISRQYPNVKLLISVFPLVVSQLTLWHHIHRLVTSKIKVQNTHSDHLSTHFVFPTVN